MTSDAVLLGVLLVVLPALSLLQGRLLSRTELEDAERIPAYLSSFVALVVLGGASVWAGRDGPGWGAMGLDPPSPLALVLWTAVLTAAGVGTMWLFRWLGTATGAQEHPALRALLPESSKERGLFAVLSFAAGTGEELAYRGYAIPLLVPILGSGGAVALTSGVFGLLHAYQGTLGMARTAVMGAILGAGFVLAGSLWPCMAAHVLLDLIGGLVLRERLMVPEPHSRV